MKQARYALCLALVCALAGFFAVTATARVFQKRSLSWHALFASMPGARLLYESALSINDTAGNVEVWTMQTDLHTIMGSINALLCPGNQTLPGLGAVDGLVLESTGESPGMVVFEPGRLGQAVGVVVRPGKARRRVFSPEGEALARVWPGLEAGFNAETGRTRMEVFEVPAGPLEALAQAESAFKTLGWKPTVGSLAADTRFLLRGREICLIRASDSAGVGGSRLSVVRRLNDD